jgi:hypothetical protein
VSTSASPTGTHVVGHQGAQVEISQRPAIAVSGSLGVVVVAGCVAWVFVEAEAPWVPILILALVVSGLVVGTGTSLPGSTALVVGDLAREVAERVTIAGVEIVEVRISHLAYASEIAQVMLRRQQANAVVAARSRIVEGAVGMVEAALTWLTANGVVSLDEERTASMVSNQWWCSVASSRRRRS